MKLANEGANKAGEVYVKNGAQRGANSWYLGLYENATEPLVTASLPAGDITETTGAGYSRQTINDADWTVDSTGKCTNVQKTFSPSANWANKITGAFICNVATGTGGLLHYVEHSLVGDMTVLSGKPVKIIPEIQVEYVP